MQCRPPRGGGTHALAKKLAEAGTAASGAVVLQPPKGAYLPEPRPEQREGVALESRTPTPRLVASLPASRSGIVEKPGLVNGGDFEAECLHALLKFLEAHAEHRGRGDTVTLCQAQGFRDRLSLHI